MSRAAAPARRRAPRGRPGRVAAPRCVAVAALALAACGDNRSARRRGAGSTLSATLVDRDGDGFLERGPRRAAARSRRRPPRSGATLATFAQLTDTHVRDEESPARVPFLDRVPGPVHVHVPPAGGVLDAGARRVGPGRQPRAAAGRVRHRRHHRQRAAQRTRPRADDPARRRGEARFRRRPATTASRRRTPPDPFYYRPDHDAPAHPGALARAQRPFRAAGLDAPWYALVGNHDVLAQGEVPPTPEIDAFADRRPARAVARPRDRGAAATRRVVRRRTGQRRPRRPVRARDGQRPGRPDRAGSSRPARPSRRSASHPSVDLGPRVRAITVDTVNREGTSQARVTPEQIDTLRAQLRAAGNRWIVVFSHNRAAGRSARARSTHTPASSPRSPATRTATRSAPAAATG